jgi:hypothetical protein
MQRMGHDSVRAAMIYQHNTREADRRIADAIDDKIKEAQDADPDDDDGTAEGFASAASGTYLARESSPMNADRAL